MSSVALGLGGFAVYVLAVVAWIWFDPRRSPVVIVVVAAAAIYGAILPLAAVVGPPTRFWPLTASYSFPTLVFLLLFGALYKSVSLRILVDLLRAPAHVATYASISRAYLEVESYHARLRILEIRGVAVRHGCRLDLTPRGRRIAAIVRRVQRVYAIEASG